MEQRIRRMNDAITGTEIPKLEAVIQECASVKYLVEMLCKNRKKKTKK
jgi:hypothetical protein